MFGQDFDVKVWSKDFEFWNLIKICVITCFFGKQNSTLGSVVPLAMFNHTFSRQQWLRPWPNLPHGHPRDSEGVETWRLSPLDDEGGLPAEESEVIVTTCCSWKSG